MAKILVEESALDSIKKMAQELQDERDELLENLKVLVKALTQESGVGGVSDNLFSAWNKAGALVEKVKK